ncbi:MAG: helix-hairpin-helix domain-containing protein [Lachnospiraceae bacterium]|nr:helix-hairpin-helix domain-containing protein [Lachnospiraceae bacterium]
MLKIKIIKPVICAALGLVCVCFFNACAKTDRVLTFESGNISEGSTEGEELPDSAGDPYGAGGETISGVLSGENPAGDIKPQESGPKGEAAGSSENTGEIYVYVCGAVKEPGLYILPEGSRINDALTLAGGFAKGADEVYLNLAAPVYDGEQLYFPLEGENVPEISDKENLNIDTDAGPSGSNGGSAMETGQPSGDGTGINLNTADVALLCSIPGIGEAKAGAIIAYREENGPFTRTEDVMNVSGIGQALYRRILPYISVGGR